MGERLIRLFVYEVYRRKLLSHKQLREMRYGMEVIYNEMIKILILIVIFTMLGKLSYFLFPLVILTTIRCFSGGLHFQTNSSCLIFSILFFMIISAAPAYLYLEFIHYRGIILAFGTVAIAVLSPIPSANRPIKSKRKQRILKIAAVLFTVFWSNILLFSIKDSGLVSCGIAAIMLQALQLIASYILSLSKNIIIKGGT